jgi:hypothetical protein
LGGSFSGAGHSACIDVDVIGRLQFEASTMDNFVKDNTNKAHVHVGKIPKKTRKKKVVAADTIKRPTIADRKICSDSVVKVLAFGCSCGNKCAAEFTKSDLLQLRSSILRLPLKKQNSILLDKLKKYGVPGGITEEGETERFIFNYRINNISVCGSFWWKAVGISKTRFLDLKNKVKNNETTEIVHKRARTKSHKTLTARNFIKHYAALHGQHVPNKPEIHLQRGVSKTDAWKTYLSDTRRNYGPQEPLLQRGQFCKVWNDDFAHLKCLKATDFARCDFCDRCRDQLAAPNLTPSIQKDLESVYERHIQNQRDARELYYRHNHKAKTDDKYCSIINDGMTQNSTRIPRFKRKAKTWEKQSDCASGPHLATHAMGTLCPGNKV